MAKYAGKDARLYIGGYDVSALMASVGLDGEIEALPYAVNDGVSGYHYIRGLNKDIVKLEGLFDDNYQSVLDSLLAASTGKQGIVTIGTALGAPSLAANSLLMPKYKWNAVVREIVKLSAELPADGLPWDECLILQPKEQKTSDGNGTALDNGAASSDGLTAYLQVFECGADDALIVKVQGDDNSGFTSPTDLITFTTANGITTERKTTTGAIERYLRVTWSGTPTYQATFAVVVKRT